MNAPSQLRPDTQAVLLLCGHFSKATNEKPLTTSEYGRLAKWLHERGQRPASLMDMSLADLGRVIEAKLDPERVRTLLGRGTALALANEKWSRSGLWVLARSDEGYPRLLKERLKADAPPLLFGAGDPLLLTAGGLAIVGSRNADDAALTFTAEIGVRCARESIAVISGGARGIDATAMQSAGEAGGNVVGVLADGLLAAVRNRQNRIGIEERRLVLISPYHPEAGFNAGNAMNRNSSIYCLADFALVVHSSIDKGGTWAGATENLRMKWVPLFVRQDPSAPGNGALLREGGMSFEYDPHSDLNLRDALGGARQPAKPGSLFPTGATAHGAMEEQIPGYATPSEATAAAEQQVSDSGREPLELDLFVEFVRRLPLVMDAAPMTAKAIGSQLKLKDAQVKEWLTRAEAEGFVSVKASKSKKYELPQPRLLP
ncbi:MAG: DNA-processing protein DprA [Betaproteobacteria bacterium]|nr:DNA-processing protein DprA [Betaproteobacteria bacterium]